MLRSQAHHLEPVVLIGKHGITDGTIESIDRVLEARELIKIKFREFKDEKLSLSEKIIELTNSQVVGVIGHTVIIFDKILILIKDRFIFHNKIFHFVRYN